MKKTGVRILCLGNPLHGNDRIGFEVFNRLQQQALPCGVELIDGGTGGMTLLPFCRDCQHVLIIDLVKSDDSDGTVRLYRDLDALLCDQATNRGEHGGDLATLVKMLPVYLSHPPKVDLMCVTANSAQAFEPVMDEAISGSLSELLRQIHSYVDVLNKEARAELS